MRVRRLLPTLVVPLALLGAACSSDDDDSTPSTTAAPAGTSVDEASQEDLARWQEDLNAVGCYAGAVDGTDGPQTEAAIEEFQAAEGLEVDGLLGPQTESALTSAADAGKQVCTSSSPDTTGTTQSTGSTATTFDPDPATNGTDEASLGEYVSRLYTTTTAECDPPTYDGPTAGVDTQVESFVADTSASGTSVGSWDDPSSQGPETTWTAEYTDGEWAVTFEGACG